MDNIKISVIIPAYNVEKYLTEAVESAVNIDEVFEIILAEDGSSDNSFKICRELKEKYPHKIKLYTHPDRKNLGAGAARNLGLEKVTGNYIAFLDADDVYLPNRFKNTIEILRNNPDIDGTYSMMGAFFESSELKKEFGKKYERPTGLTKDTDPSVLFETLIKQGNGWIHLNTLTVKKNMIEKTGYFDENLKISQDTHFIWKLALCGKLKREPGDGIVAERRVHETNRITDKKKFYTYHKMLVPSFLKWAEDYNKDIKKYLPALTFRHLKHLEGFSCVFSNEDFLLKFLFVKELINMPFYLKKLFFKYAFGDCVSFIFKKKVFTFTTYDEFLKYLKKNNLQKQINKLAGKYKNKKIIIYGAGAVFDVIADNFDIGSLNIEYISDIKFNEFGEYKGFKTIPYKNISGQNPDMVLVTLQDNYIIKYFFEDEIFPKYGKFKYTFLDEEI